MDYQDNSVGQLELANRRQRDFRGMPGDGRDTGIQQIGQPSDPYTRALQAVTPASLAGVFTGATRSPSADPTAGTSGGWNAADAASALIPGAGMGLAAKTTTAAAGAGARQYLANQMDQPDRPGTAAPDAATSSVTMIDPTTGTPVETTAGLPSLPPAVRQGFAHYGTLAPVSPIPENGPTTPQSAYGNNVDARGGYQRDYNSQAEIGDQGPPSPQYAGYAQGGTIGERRNYTAQDLAAMAGPPPAPGTMTTEQANSYYGGLNRLAASQDQQNRDDAQHRAGLSAQAIGDRLNAENKSWAAYVDAGSKVGGRDQRQLKALLSADEARNARGVANVSRFASEAAQGPNYVGQATAMNAQERAGSSEAIAQQQARQGLVTGQQNQEIGAITLDQHKTQQRLLGNIEKAKTADERQAAVNTYYASVLKEPPKPEPIVHGRGAEYTKPGELAPTKEADFFATRDATGKVQIIKGGGESAPVPSANHIAALKADPKKMTDLFDQIYGKGAAARILEAN